ncbi:hypothetical protein [Mesorhizobium huakuii]|uniref:hypothetical protein n=1 Tax=Mesorhizobium huakuii TaxID=28104 RepID=UPI001617D4AC|nr:hypothetical protein [Mesorhizobium huakuii]
MAREVAIHWWPLALLSKSFCADRIGAERIPTRKSAVVGTQPPTQGGEAIGGDVE